MSLREALAALTTDERNRCRVGNIRTTLDEDDLAALDAALTADIPAKSLAAALTAEGHQVGATTVNSHRRGECRCAQ